MPINVANLELCKELYELSGWSTAIGTNQFWYIDGELVIATFVEGGTPAYDCGYLLVELPQSVQVEEYKYGLTLSVSGIGNIMWGAGYEHHFSDGVDERHTQLADTPEDALCKLAIELFKKDVLQKEVGNDTN